MNRWARRYYPLMLATLSLTFVYLYSATDRKDLLQSDTTVIYPYGNSIGGSNLRQFHANHEMKRSAYHVHDIGNSLPPINQLLDMDNFKFLKNCSKLCYGTSSTNNNSQINLLAFVHTSPINFNRRRIIRKTWASPNIQQLLGIKVIFLLGLPNNTETQDQLNLESSRYGDIVQGNFVDSYKNLTYKHLMGYKWVLTYCRSTKFIMKIDDDAFVDIFRVVSLLKQTFQGEEDHHHKNDADDESRKVITQPNGIITCSLFPEGSLVKRQGKWKLSPEDYPFDTFPAYCSGIGYFLTPDVAQDLYLASNQVRPFLWIDDLFITGILVAQFPLRHQPINFKFTYSPSDLRKWLKSKERKPCPYIIGDIGDTLDWEVLMVKLWDKTRSYFVP